MSQIIFYVTLLVYTIATAAYAVFFFSQRKDVRRIARAILFAAGILHTLYLVTRYFVAGHTPLTSNHDVVSFFAWSVAWGFLAFRWRYQVKNFGSFVSLLITVLLAVAAASSSQTRELPPEMRIFWLPVHASIVIMAYGFLAMAFCGGIMYLLQERELKGRRFGMFFSRLPSLDSLDNLIQHCLSIGFPLMTIGMITGSLWAKQAFGAFWSWDPKETWSLVTWFLYAGILHQRFTVGWRGRRVAILVIVGFAVSLIAFWVPSNYHITGM